MLYTGFKGIQFLKLSMATVLKNCTNIIILFADWYLYGQTVNVTVSKTHFEFCCFTYVLR